MPYASATGAWNPVATTEGGLTSFAWTEGDRLLINTGNGTRSFVAVVNVGPTIPRRQPGEQAIGREDFRRWFPQIAAMGFRALRVYTIMPPHFYQELEAFNLANPEAPLLLISRVILESTGAVREVRALKDEGFLYLRIRTDENDLWRETPLVIGLDVIAGASGALPNTDGIYPEADYAVVLDGDSGHMMVRASNDPYAIQYAWLRDYEPVDPADFEEGSGV
jgi:hypothetical protein